MKEARQIGDDVIELRKDEGPVAKGFAIPRRRKD